MDQVEEFQETFLSRMRGLHFADVLEPLSKGSTDPAIFAIIEKAAASTVNGMR